MLSSAIIVFREVFEIVLIVGIVIAATRGVPERNKAIGLGFAGGITGSLIVAFFTGQISNLAEGMGQEYFNAGILFLAAGFIGWTLLWMKKHGKEMRARFEDMGAKVKDGSIPFFSLSLVIALAILREGSEIALFSYGMIAAGHSVSSIVMGAVIGTIGGAVLGGMLYFGLIQLSLKWFFRVTTALLVVLVAGMVSQAIGFLTAAGAFGTLSQTVWDSSWFLSEHGIVGESLKVLAGYTARPSVIQLIAYVSTLGLLVALMRYIGKTDKLQAGVAATALFCVALSSPAHATKTVSSPYVESGEAELEYKGGYDIDDDNDIDGGHKHKLGFGYGVNDFWFTELAIEFEKDGESGSEIVTEGIEWENKFQLTNPGEYWVDVGAKLELFYNTEGGADKAETKLLLGKSTQNFKHLANVKLEREFGEDASDETEYGASWSSRYRYSPTLEPGFEIHSDFGELGEGTDFDDQTHQVGPVIYGKLGSIKYDVGYLFGVSDHAPDGSIKAIFEYEWQF